MKRYLAAALALICLLTAGCGMQETQEPGVRLWVDIDTAQSIRGLSWEYSLEGEILGTGAVINADGSRMEAGQGVMLQFLPEDFPEGRIPERFQVQVYLLDHRDTETAVNSPVTVFSVTDDGCRYRLTGSEPEGYCLVRTK